MKIEAEPLTRELFDELLPLAQKCWEDSTKTKLETCAFYGERDFAVEPDFEGYMKLQDLDSLVIITLRDDAVLKGYIIGLFYKSLHHRKILCSGGDSMYVEPSHRSYAPVLVDKFESESTKKGAAIIGWPTTQGGYIYELLKAMKYVGDDIVMEKRLCV